MNKNHITLGESGETCTAMCKYGKAVEIYTKSSTFRIDSSGDTSMERIPWMARKIRSIGSSNSIISRIFIQSSNMIDGVLILDQQVNRSKIIDHMHGIADKLLMCDETAVKLCLHISTICESIQNEGIKQDGGGKFLNPFPCIENLERDCSQYLIEANRTAKAILEMPSLFGLTSSKGLKPATVIGGLNPQNDAVLIRMLKKFEPISTKINDLRNHQGHTETSETKISDFALSHRLDINPPMWEIVGKTKYESSLISEDIQEFNKNLFHAAEGIFMHCLLSAATPKIPYVIESIPDESIDLNCPVKYKLSIIESEIEQKAG